MHRNTADYAANVKRFVERAAQNEVVWYLGSDEGVAFCDSDADDSDGLPMSVMLFYSDEAYARRCQAANFEDHEVRSMPLFDFLYQWLPSMTADEALVGPNWTQDLAGLELDAFELRERIEAALTEEQQESYAEAYREMDRS